MMMMKIEMMEAKLWFALCALLLVIMGSADEAANTMRPEATKNGTSMPQLSSVSPAASNLSTEAPETGANSTKTTKTFSTSAPHTTQSSSNHTTPSHDASTSSVLSNNSTHNETSSSTSVSAHNTTTTAAPVTAATTTASNAVVSRDTNTSQPSTAANQSSSATTKPSPVTTMALLTITSTHAESSPHLTIQGSKSQVSSGLDPLLVGLVSAFIITAIVITLLLFLKFRRRQSGPQFHRLQDLPMDDMMEEAPLSMYSY